MEKVDRLPSYRLPIEELLNSVANASLVPGSIAMCALMGAAAASLVSMVGRLTANRDEHEPVREEMLRVSNRAIHLSDQLQSIIDQEAQAHNRLSQAHSLPQSSSEEQKIRNDCIQIALKNYVQVPLLIAQYSFEILQLAETIIRYGYSGLRPDSATAIMVCIAAIRGAALSIRSSLGPITDAEWVKGTAEKLEKILTQTKELEKDLETLVS
ncbi:MAG TPA: cyclodeaminase/cyclohydrolase family protein [Chroococcales cyanobacterium]